MPSLTYWNRLEPRPRKAGDLGANLAARVRDPLWMLTRQWQFGEFQGEDAGSPAYAQLQLQTTPIVGWRGEGGPDQPLASGRPIEEAVQREPFAANIWRSVELGQQLEVRLQHAGASRLVADFRAAYPIVDRQPAASADRETEDEARWRAVVGGRAVDGAALVEAVRAAAPDLPDRPAIAAADVPLVRGVLEDFARWADGVFGRLAAGDAAAWQPARLEYRADALAHTPEGARAVLSCRPDAQGRVDWYAFDVQTIEKATARPAVPATVAIVPTHVRFPGMPNTRWWDFESAATDFGALTPQRTDVATLLVMDFMLIAANDWFVVPLPQRAGTLSRIDWIVVHDVFGETTLVPRADRDKRSAGSWTLFSMSGPSGVAPFHIVPPTVGPGIQVGLAIEDVRFIKDEGANMVWGIEHTVEGALGQPLPGQERARPAGAGAPRQPGADTTLRYRIQTEVPPHWIPFLPVLVDRARGDIALERAAMTHLTPGGTLAAVKPRGRILQPAGGQPPYRLFEEEVSRSGTRVERVVYRARCVDGSTLVWIGRRRSLQSGEGEASSGLRFDVFLR